MQANRHQTTKAWGELTVERAPKAALVERAQRADSAAFETLYRAHVDKVYGLCLRMTGNAAEAEDCTQEAFILAWRKLDKFRGDSAFGTWMHRVAVNAVLGRMRKAKREHERLQVISDVVAAPESIGGCQVEQDMCLYYMRFMATRTMRPATCWASRAARARRNCIGQRGCWRRS